jgi:hypothetical protein
MRTIKRLLTIAILTTMMMLIYTPSFAEDPDPWNDSEEDTPIDGGTSLLVATAVGYGIKKAREARKNGGKK